MAIFAVPWAVQCSEKWRSVPAFDLACGSDAAIGLPAHRALRDLEIKRHIDDGSMPGPKIQRPGRISKAKVRLRATFRVEWARRCGAEWWNLLDGQGVDNFKAYKFLTRR